MHDNPQLQQKCSSFGTSNKESRGTPKNIKHAHKTKTQHRQKIEKAESRCRRVETKHTKMQKKKERKRAESKRMHKKLSHTCGKEKRAEREKTWPHAVDKNVEEIICKRLEKRRREKEKKKQSRKAARTYTKKIQRCTQKKVEVDEGKKRRWGAKGRRLDLLGGGGRKEKERKQGQRQKRVKYERGLGVGDGEVGETNERER